MPLTISTEATTDKNKLRSNVVWIDFVEILYPGEDAVRICSDNQITTWNGHTWYPADFQPPQIKESKNSQIPDVTFAFADIEQTVIPIIDKYNGAIGAEVNLYTVLSTMLDSDVPEREENMELLGANVSHDSIVTFDLGAENLQDRKCTPNRYLKNHCTNTFKGDRCGYAGAETDCDFTFSRCKALGNQRRYRGFPSVGNIGYMA